MRADPLPQSFKCLDDGRAEAWYLCMWSLVGSGCASSLCGLGRHADASLHEVLRTVRKSMSDMSFAFQTAWLPGRVGNHKAVLRSRV